MSKTINKAELVSRIAIRTEVTHQQALTIVDAMLEEVQAAVEQGGKVTLVGFGTFAAREQAARTARNPRTGEQIPVEAKVVPTFKVGIPFKERVKNAASKAQ